MTEELKNSEVYEEEAELTEENVENEDNDADIDRYIRQLTGKEEPKKEEDEEKEPEVEHFRVTSQIGEEDHKTFIYFSTLLRYKWMLPTFIVVPIIFAVFFAFQGGQFYSDNLILGLAVLYLAIFLIVVIRCQRWLSKIKKNNPKAMYLTDTTLVFLTRSIVHTKNSNRSKVSYKHMIGVAEGKKHYYMYFDNGKSMVFRKEDMPAETLDAFRPFIEARVHKKSLKQLMRG